MSTSSAFWVLFFAVQLLILQARNTAFGLTKLAAAACMQCTAQRQQKAASTSLLESRNLLQTATLVFPRSIVCSRLSNNINILAKNFFRLPTGGAWPPAPPLIRHCTYRLHTSTKHRVKQAADFLPVVSYLLSIILPVHWMAGRYIQITSKDRTATRGGCDCCFYVGKGTTATHGADARSIISTVYYIS